MREAFEVALNMANMYELREENWIVNTYSTYLSEAIEKLEHTIEEGEKAQDILNELSK